MAANVDEGKFLKIYFIIVSIFNIIQREVGGHD
jgi:predicted nucleic acid-binding protein